MSAAAQQTRGDAEGQGPRIELTILMPCLNEIETLAACIEKATRFLAMSGIAGEVLVADNGSTDGSPELARHCGARVVNVAKRGYGAALLGGIEAAHGRFVIVGDADDSYDFSRLQPFIEQLRAGAALVMGNRFQGGIAPGAMPPLHRYFGNPVLSFLGRRFFRVPIGDFHCGLRGFDRDRMRALKLRTTGMEFASEMVVRAALAGYPIAEVPTTLSPDGRSRRPHLRAWRDGWRHLRFLLVYSPRWLFLYPGAAVALLGLGGVLALFKGPLAIGSVSFDIRTFVVACLALLIGIQLISFAVVARRIGILQGFLPATRPLHAAVADLTIERLLMIALTFFLGGLAGGAWSFIQWADVGFGELLRTDVLRVVILSLTAVAVAIQLAFTAFLASIFDIAVT